MPEEERLKILRDVAENGGKKSFEDKKGIHGRSSEQHINDGKNSALSRGFVPYFYELKETEFNEMYEWNYILRLREEGLCWREIREQTNRIYNTKRSPSGLRQALYRQKIKKTKN